MLALLAEQSAELLERRPPPEGAARMCAGIVRCGSGRGACRGWECREHLLEVRGVAVERDALLAQRARL